MEPTLLFTSLPESISTDPEDVFALYLEIQKLKAENELLRNNNKSETYKKAYIKEKEKNSQLKEEIAELKDELEVSEQSIEFLSKSEFELLIRASDLKKKISTLETALPVRPRPFKIITKPKKTCTFPRRFFKVQNK